MFENIIKEIRAYDRIIIHRHSNPDGDALGSQIGLKHILKENFPEKQVLAVGDGPKRYGFMDDSVMDELADSDYAGALAVILDTSAKALISDGRYTLAEKTLRIDHHIFCETIADVEVTDTGYESCCGLIAAFAMECGLRLTPIAAKSLFTGMVTDSGRFRYDSTSARTFRLAAFLMEQPFDIGDIYRNLYADDFSMIRLRAQFVLKVNFTEHNVAYIYTDRAQMQTLNADTFTVSRGMVNTMSDIRGVDIWVNFTETEAGVLCELRSGRYNINPIAVKYGGGGHAKASGATVKTREEAMRMLADLDAMAGEDV
ncbi:MAG: bifunctional oligoribonuclease/PAP phosphatase NrnA [Oscillospiraceae bacterium]|nr:bifunctional oligoribonuclease/PAP phosphatase NrnA [Oscillospiraceae bacterium]